MSAAGAQFFDWVQGATFYVDLHREAVELALAAVPRTVPPSWIDVGCGPGLVARLAAELGARATGVDSDRAMIRTARRHPSTARFEIGDVAQLVPESADIVSAASLLYAMPDPSHAASMLWSAVRPGGALLIIETSAAMTVDAATALVPNIARHRRHALMLWARARRGSTLDRGALEAIPTHQRTTTPLLHGLVEAIVAVKPC